MRDAFLNSLTERAAADSDLILLTADLGFGVFETFEARFPGQYFNVGVAEQNMMGVAAGLALEGKRVVTYSIGNFPSLRCLEQIRNDACYHQLNITIVASGGGFSYGPLGMSHHATEDLAILRALPGMTVTAPCSAQEAGWLTHALLQQDGVGYLRLDKSAAPEAAVLPFEPGRCRLWRQGGDFTLIAAGGILHEALRAADALAQEGVHCRVLGCHTLKPLDVEAVLAAARETGGILTLEEHNVIGGLGGAVAETCLEQGSAPQAFLRLGLRDEYIATVGGQAYLRARHGLDAAAVIQAVRRLMERR